MKRITAMFLFFVLLFSKQPVKANAISIRLNGASVAFDAPPQLVNDRVLVPFRGLLEEMGYAVFWDDSTRQIIGMYGDIRLILTVDSSTALWNQTEYPLDAPVTLYNDRAYVPLRFVAEAAGYSVQWVPQTQTVLLTQAPQARVSLPLSFDFEAQDLSPIEAYIRQEYDSNFRLSDYEPQIKQVMANGVPQNDGSLQLFYLWNGFVTDYGYSMTVRNGEIHTVQPKGSQPTGEWPLPENEAAYEAEIVQKSIDACAVNTASGWQITKTDVFKRFDSSPYYAVIVTLSDPESGEEWQRGFTYRPDSD